MCGISGMVTGSLHNTKVDVGWLAGLSETLSQTPPGEGALGALKESLETLGSRFADLMSFATYAELIASPHIRQSSLQLADALARHCDSLIALSYQGRTDLDPLIEGLRDYGWQIREELIGGAERIESLIPAEHNHSRRFVAWSVQHVLQALDRLEVRGRDSAGTVIQLSLAENLGKIKLTADLSVELESRQKDILAGHRAVFLSQSQSGGPVASFVYKTSNLIGGLGDNCAALRKAIRDDELFWQAADITLQLSVLAHTRWASNGVISVPNCHPVNASVNIDDSGGANPGAMFVLNGDVDNYSQLLTEFVTSRQRSLERTITTDAKIIPIVHRWTERKASELDRFRSSVRRLEGSMTIVTVNPRLPTEVMLAQKGSGQTLYASRLADGWMFASEIYGIAGIARHSFNLGPAILGGAVSRLSADSELVEAISINGGEPIQVLYEQIQIFARDIYRGNYEYFLQKEIHDAPSSIEKTLRGRYVKHQDGGIDFECLPVKQWNTLRNRVAKGLGRIIVIGQGTAGVAAVGIAHHVERGLVRNGHTKITVQASRSSELSASIDQATLDDTLLIAVSQSGTTTDTNRAVDLARERGAFVHAIVNRRNSDLVRKADSVIFTSDGRDVEMSVASTKAFYSQIVAGKLTALCLADALQTMDKDEIAYECTALETLPDRVRDVLAAEQTIARYAQELAPYSRYWAVTGSGVNYIAALEIRIKLSELCYKSIPVDFTEDKKHIDLSTEPLTLVIANDLSPTTANDIVKEVAIFSAHSGKPVVFASAGAQANAFRPYAERVIELPAIGADLGFVIATAAGHLWAFHAARAIDAGAQRIKALLRTASDAAEEGDATRGAASAAASASPLIREIDELVASAADGCFDSGLSASDIAVLSRTSLHLQQLLQSGETANMRAEVSAVIPAIKSIFDEVSRPIDTIRHQAKTVTVGTTRADDALSLVISDALSLVEVPETRINARSRRQLSALSKLTDAVFWAATYQLNTGPNGDKLIALNRYTSSSAPYSGYASEPEEPIGLFRRCMKGTEAVVGTVGPDRCVVFPIFSGETTQVELLCCMALQAVSYASREQKEKALLAFDLDFEILSTLEQKHGRIGRALLAEVVAKNTPERLLFDTLPSLVESSARRVA